MNRRITKHKESILELFEKHHILNAKEIAKALPDIDTSTIYRNLDRFVADGILKEVRIFADAISYETANHPHEHFVCDGCHDVHAISLPHNITANIVPEGFIVTEGETVIRGYCKSCS